MQGDRDDRAVLAILSSFVSSWASPVCSPRGRSCSAACCWAAGASTPRSWRRCSVGGRLVHLDSVVVRLAGRVLRRGAVLGLAAAGCRAHPVVPLRDGAGASIKSEYGVDVPWWIWVIAGGGAAIYFAYQGITLSEKALIITGLSRS